MKILIVEDEERIRKVVRSFLVKNGYIVREAADGEEGLDLFYEWNPDLVLLDVMMPKKDGYEVCRAIKSEKTTPVLMLTAKTQEEDEIRGLEIGADDYIRKPFSLKILELRLKNLLGDEIYTIGNFRFLKNEKNVYLNEKIVDLPPKEYDLLFYLAKNHSKIFSREQILNNVWDLLCESDPRTVDTHIKNLRKKIGHEYITTVKGFGYKFEVKNENNI
ncbi:Staphylococcal respiratory response protein A [Sebaldella termitidis]|jgi:DNA-binding response OmpR family regulator|uniref:Two component transcriptional regulator, winged helix family n=1 Tax=Sebaldella termitidis (strain ATCC 33386 / NCTC 11300) TaxID=526218 RepID=D1AFW6_SEBTE|nr:response regulator transcription factor [Sebaldella termitidis]ACZ08001.1 two component transcriptional regulator, winged helix family [Sebaldella termitidis ATCC 33386]SUI23302.1 Staphylococcal respiratory response protein A [Sebaldella termitidis]